MLRTWMGWDKFCKLTITIQTKYRNGSINTDTLAREVTTIMGYDMFPFFDQWIRDQGVPKVHYTWSVAAADDGKFLVTLKARQEDLENFKFMMIPISLHFGKNQPVVVMKPFVKPEVEIQLKVPERPVDVRLDDEASQLAEFIRDGAK
jgi:aminopeptidase N